MKNLKTFLNMHMMTLLRDTCTLTLIRLYTYNLFQKYATNKWSPFNGVIRKWKKKDITFTRTRIVHPSTESINIWIFSPALKAVENFVHAVSVFVKLENSEIVLIHTACYNHKGLTLKTFLLIIIILLHIL